MKIEIDEFNPFKESSEIRRHRTKKQFERGSNKLDSKPHKSKKGYSRKGKNGKQSLKRSNYQC